MKFRAVMVLLFAILPARAGEVERLSKVVVKWQPRLHLEDWQITVRMATLAELLEVGNRPCVAASLFNPVSRRGLILVLRKSEYTPEIKSYLNISDIAADQRDSVVHELLHCVLDNFPEEAAVSILAAALKP